MSNQGFGSLERDVLRERQAKERAQLLGKTQETLPPPIFSEPIKVDPSLEDETSKRVKSTLGDFDQAILNTDPKNLIGISRSGLLASHISKTNSSSSVSHNAAKISSSGNDSGRKPNLLNGQHKTHHWNAYDAEKKRGISSSYQKNKDFVKTNNLDNKIKKRAQSSNNSSAIIGEAIDKHKVSSCKTKNSSAFHHSEKDALDNLCEDRLLEKAADNLGKPENERVAEQAEYKIGNQQQVESILQEMKINVPPLLTAICTPGRDETTSNLSSAEELVAPFASQGSDHSAGVEQCTDSTTSLFILREDLEVSESDDEMGHEKSTQQDTLLNSDLASPDLNILQPPPPVDAMSSSAKSSGESEVSEPEISVAAPIQTAKKSSKNPGDHEVSRIREKKRSRECHQRNDKGKSAALKQDGENEKAASDMLYDKGVRNAKISHEKDNKKSLLPHLSDLEMNLVQDAIKEETLSVCPPLHPICVSPMSPPGHNVQESRPLPVSKPDKMEKRKRNESDHYLPDSRNRDKKSASQRLTSSNVKVDVDTTISTLAPTDSAVVSSDSIAKTDSEKSKKYKLKQEKVKKDSREKLVKMNEENKTKTHKRTNSLGKKTHVEQHSRSSTPKEVPKMDEESKVPKGIEAQKKKGKFHRFKSKEFITDSPEDSNSEDSDFDRPVRQADSLTKNSSVKTSLNDIESIPVKPNCLTAKLDDICEQQVMNSHSEQEGFSSLVSKEVLERVATNFDLAKNIAAVVKPLVLDKLMNEDVLSSKAVNTEVPNLKPVNVDIPNSKPTKCQNIPIPNTKENQDKTSSLLVSIDLRYIDRIPKLDKKKTCEKQEVKVDCNANTSLHHSNLSQTEKASKESHKRKSSDDRYKIKKLKVITAAASPKTTVPTKKEKAAEKEESWNVKITPKSSERGDSPNSLCSFSSQQSHRSASRHGRGKSVDKTKKEKKTKEISQSEQKLKGHVSLKEAKFDDERKHKVKKEKSEEPSKNKERSKSAAKQQNSDNSQGSSLEKSSQAFKSENDYRTASRQDESASVSHDDVTEWNSNSSWLHPKQGIECEQARYMNEAKKLKHEADIESDFRIQAMKYLDAVLCFILAGMAQEKSHCNVSQIYTLYKETLDLIRFIASKFQKSAQSSSQNGSMDTKLFVLSLRCQSLLYLKLYCLRKVEVREIHKSLSKFHKQKPSHRSLQTPPVATLSQPQPSPGHLKGGMPSPHSPTPSPAGSVASVGSQSSGYSSSEINGAQCRNVNTDGIINNPLPAVPSSQQPCQDHHDVISLPHTTYNMLQRQNTHLGNLHLCHDLWEQADIRISHGHCKDFFKLLDSICGRLTLHSSFPELVEYIRKGLSMLKEET